MRPLSASELLGVWERGQTQHPIERPLTLLAAASPETLPADLRRLPIGERDSRLLTLREWTFGARLGGLAACSVCGTTLELDFETADIRATIPSDAPLQLSDAESGEPFRLPNSDDLLAVAHMRDLAAMRSALIARCVLDASSPPADTAARIAALMEQADPQANVRLDLTCAACGHRWQLAFDISSYFWSELNAWARRMLSEIHILASAYGWREADILALSPLRRHAYLDMLGATA